MVNEQVLEAKAIIIARRNHNKACQQWMTAWGTFARVFSLGCPGIHEREIAEAAQDVCSDTLTLLIEAHITTAKRSNRL